MSLLPLILSELDSYRRPVSLYDQNFGLGLLRDELMEPTVRTHTMVPLLSTHYLRPWRSGPQRQSGMSHVTCDKDGFKVNLDVQQFKPEEVNVKVVDRSIVVEGKHEERQDEHGYISRQFTRRYALPENVDPDTVASTLSSDGVLTVSAAPKDLPPSGKERTVQITHTQAPALTNQRTEQKSSGDKMEQ